jgi:hypothetical protein
MAKERGGKEKEHTAPVTDSHVQFIFLLCALVFLFSFSLPFPLCKTTTADCALRTVHFLFILLLRTVDCAHSRLMYKGCMTADCRLRIIHVYKVAH